MVQRGWARGLTKRKMPNTTSAIPAPMCSTEVSVITPRPSTSPATTASESSWPMAIGGSARSTARRSRSCIPSATAKSHPMAGFSPWYAPSRAIRIQSQREWLLTAPGHSFGKQ